MRESRRPFAMAKSIRPDVSANLIMCTRRVGTILEAGTVRDQNLSSSEKKNDAFSCISSFGAAMLPRSYLRPYHHVLMLYLPTTSQQEQSASYI
jgi:hypothetical protein